MFKQKYTTRTTQVNNNSSIIFAIVTGDFESVKTLVNTTNLNNVIDEDTGFNALHYSIASPNINVNIIKYLLDLGANPKTKNTVQNVDAFDLAIRYNKKYLFEYFNQIQDTKISNLNDDIQSLNKKVDTLNQTNSFLTNSINKYNDKINNLNDIIKYKDGIIEQKDKQIIGLKKKNEESETAFNNLLKKFKK